MNRTDVLFTISAILIVIAACTSVELNVTDTPEPIPDKLVVTIETKNAFAEEVDQTPTPMAATAAPEPQIIEAVVWHENPQIPILNFHRFTPRLIDQETGTLMQLTKFKTIIQGLYEAGYSLISVRDYLDGRIVVPEGRKPLILSIDDAYFANQLALNEDGTPSDKSGVGWLYDFSQKNPDFGFHVAMFANFGDKYYGNVFRYDWWYLGEGWEDDFAKTIVWGMEHNVMPYNHLWRHPDLEQLADKDILMQAQKNDEALRGYLQRAERGDLIARLDNFIALPYGKWPLYESGVNTLLSYVDPEGKPLEAVFEAGYEYKPMMALSPFDEEFDAFHIPRMAPVDRVVEFVLENAENLPSNLRCLLELPAVAGARDEEALIRAIELSIKNHNCPEGIFIIGELVFVARHGTVLPWN